MILLCFLPELSLAQKVHSPHIYQENELWGLANEKPITPAVYDTIIAIDNRNFFIAKKHKTNSSINTTGVISAKGKILIPFIYLQIIPSSDNYIVKKWENGAIIFGVLSSSNKTILNSRFKQIKTLGNYWIAQSSQGMHLYRQDGSILKEILADSISVSPNLNFIYTYKGGKTGLIDKLGKEVYATEYKSITYKNSKWVTTSFSKWQLITSSDTTLIHADSVQIWDLNTQIIGVNNSYQIIRNNVSTGNSYDAINIVAPSFAITQQSSSLGAIHKNGKEVLPPIYHTLYYKKGYFYANKNHSWVLSDSLGAKRSIFKYDSIGAIHDGLFPIKRKGKWGFMNRAGKEVIHCIYNSNAHFKNGKAIINYHGANGIIDLEGKWIVKPIYENITGYSFNFFIYIKDGIYHLKNYNDEIIYFSNHELVFKGETIYEIRASNKNEISSMGTIVKKALRVSESSKFWHIIKVNDKYGFKDSNGLLKITYRYDGLKPFTEDLAAFKLRGKWGFINSNEKIIIQPHYSEVTAFKNGLSIVSKKGNKGLINFTGKTILKPKYESIKLLKDDLWLVTQNGLTGLFTSQGNIIIQPKYDRIEYIRNNLLIVIKNGIYGAVNIKGVSVLPRAYSYIGYNTDYGLLILKKHD